MVPHPFGVTEVSEGNVRVADEDVEMKLTAKNEEFSRSSTAKPLFIKELRRFYQLKCENDAE
jgi:hypothetical protein